MAQQGSHANVFDNLFERHFQLFLVFFFVVTELRDATQIVDCFADFAFHFGEFGLHHAETEQEMLSRINRGRNPMAAMVQGPLKVYVTSNGRTEGKTLRPDALFNEHDGATWVEVDRSKRGSDREAGLRALALAVGSDLIDGQRLRRVVVFCKSDRIQGRALAVLRALAREQSGKVLVSGRRQFKETSDGVFEVTAAQEVKLSDGRVMEKPVVAGHLLVQALPTWLP